MPRLGAHAATVVGVATVLAAVAFGAQGGLRLERLTWTEIGLVLTGTALVLAALLTARVRGRVHGGLTLLALAVLTVLTAGSISWSLFPAGSWEEANRTFSYLVAFAGALAFVRIAPLRWAAVLEGVALACVVVCGWALLTKVFPSALAHDETFARLREPFGYWNAVGLMAVLGMPPLLWLAARRSGHGAVNALAWPALALLDVALMLSYSRGALLALLVGLVFWFAAVPLRLRSALPLVTAALVAAPVIAWAFARDALSTDNVPLAARVDAGHSLGALLLLVCAILLAAGLVVNFAAAGRSPKPRTRRLAGQAVGGVLVLSVLAVVIGLAAAPGGIDGQVSKAWRKVTDPNVAAPTNTPDRLTATSSVRAQYWQEALRIYKDSKLVGAGAGAYEVARTRYRRGTQSIRHAHGYGVQTLADLGLVGLGVSLLGALAWIVAATGATGLRRRDRGLPYDPERIGLLTMSTVVLVFALPLADRLDVVRARHGGGGAAVRRLGGRARAAARSPGGERGACTGAGAALVAPRPRDRRGGARGRRARAHDLLDRAAAGACRACGGPLGRPRLRGQARARRRRGAAGRRPQPALGRPAVRARVRPGRPGQAAGRARHARGGGPPAARQLGDVAAAGPLPAVGAQRPEGRAARVPRRLLPRPPVGPRAVGLPRGRARGPSATLALRLGHPRIR